LNKKSMEKELHILILEDNSADAELMEHELSDAGIVFLAKRVETRDAFIKELTNSMPDIILTDHKLPAFDGSSALAIAKMKCPDVPVIFVTGALGEEKAVEILKKGATDYILKHRLSHLAPAVKRALREAEERAERKRAEKQLKESLKEKEILLREIHHRVKNNMQVISSLLILQEELSKDEKVIEMLKDSQNRIMSMALIHEKLYRSENLSKIDLKEYIDDLVSGLFQSYGISDDEVTLNINVENFSLGIDSAIPCGLIINELVSNSLKHAFPDGRSGEIKIFIRSTNEMIELVIGDNGVGIPKDVDLRKTKSLGLHIVNVLVEKQLHGEIALNREKGTEFRIEFRGMK